jgi:hypothetical protein
MLTYYRKIKRVIAFKNRGKQTEEIPFIGRNNVSHSQADPREDPG